MGIRGKQKGFTLIELLVVISIISLLSSVVLSSVNTARVKARDTKRKSDLHQIRLALNLYYDKYGYYPPPKAQTSCGGTDPAWASSNGSCGGQWLSTDINFYQFMPSVPIDPVNTGVNAGWAPVNYTYSYYPAGTDDYNLVTQLENQGDSARCVTTPAYYHQPGAQYVWCSAVMNPARNDSIYADH